MAGQGPLAGVRVLEIGGIGPGPFAAMMLADLGADVIRVDRPNELPLFPLESMLLHRGRRSIIVDLRHDRGAEVIISLSAGGYVVM